jgi:hypothetical protein
VGESGLLKHLPERTHAGALFEEQTDRLLEAAHCLGGAAPKAGDAKFRTDRNVLVAFLEDLGSNSDPIN